MAKPGIITLKNKDITLKEKILLEFMNEIRGQVLYPENTGYDNARKVWNGMIDNRPALIVRCSGVADVVNSVRFAREHNLLVSVRGGGHSLAGHGVCNDGLMIDMSLMNSIRVDPSTQTARAEGGARWRDFDHETQVFGLATTGGTNSDTGIAGLTLGGGLGWLAGKYGLTCDNLLSADVVTADGNILTASSDEHEDLFWGLRGGSGNFGIVTSFNYQLHKVGKVLAGMVIHPFESAREVLRFYRDFSTSIPDEVNTICNLFTTPEGKRMIAIAACYNGSLKKGKQVLKPLRSFGSPVADQIVPMPYTLLQSMTDDIFPRGRQYYWKARLINKLSDDAIEIMIDYFCTAPSPFTVVGLQQLGNAANRVAPEETAFSHREALYDFLMLSGWENPAANNQNIKWTRDLDDAMQPYLHGGIYVNAFTEDFKKGIRAAYRPGTYEKLITLKNKYDPSNFFRLNPNIKPTVKL